MLHFQSPVLEISTSFGRTKVHVGRYPQGGAIAIWLTCEGPFGPEPLATFSTNLVPYGSRLAHDELNVKNWAENESLVAPLMQTGIFQDTGRKTSGGYVQSPIWRVVDPRFIPPES